MICTTPHPSLRTAVAAALVILVATTGFASAEPTSTSKTVCLVQEPETQPAPVPLGCGQAIVTSQEPTCGTIAGVYACKVQSQMILTVSGPAACGRAATNAVPSFPLALCTAAIPARAVSPMEELTFTDIPPEGRSHTFDGEVCVRLSFEDATEDRCRPFAHTIWLPGPVAATPDGVNTLLFLGLPNYVGHLASYSNADPEPVVLVS